MSFCPLFEGEGTLLVFGDVKERTYRWPIKMRQLETTDGQTIE